MDRKPWQVSLGVIARTDSLPAFVHELSDVTQGLELGRDVVSFVHVRCPTMLAFPAVWPVLPHVGALPPGDASRALGPSLEVRPVDELRPPFAFAFFLPRGLSVCYQCTTDSVQ